MNRNRLPRGSTTEGMLCRRLALQALQSVQEGGFVQNVLEKKGGDKLLAHDRRLLREIVMGVLRHRRWLDDQIAPLLNTTLDSVDAPVLSALRIGVFQLRKLDRVPAHAAVATTVEAYKQEYGRKAAGFVNGVLRNVLRKPYQTPDAPTDLTSISALYSQPLWLLKRWHASLDLGEIIQLCEALNTPAPLVIRPNVLKDRGWLKSQLEGESASCALGQWTPYALQLKHPMPFASESFRKGFWVAQDQASQLVVELLDPQRGEDIWDVCAAPGGKTALIDWLTQGASRILATDVNSKKIDRLSQISFIGEVECKQHDAVAPFSGRRFDRILLDAPCSATGVIRRHPEIKWRRTPADVDKLAKTQMKLLNAVQANLKVGGVLVYSVCSGLISEGIEHITRFLEENPNFCVDPPETNRVPWEKIWQNRGITLWPHRHGTDSFFMIRLKRKA